MKINISQPVLDYENKEIKTDEKGGVLTYFDVFINSINSNVQGETPLTAEKKNQIFQLSKKMYSHKDPNFTPEELTLIKERVSKAYAPLVYGRVVEIIDGTANEEEVAQIEANENSDKK